MNYPRVNINNNLELLRLLFAFQVVIYHAASHILEKKLSVINYLPGVPAFFFVSGFLIYASYLRSRSLYSYFSNRFFRIFPGLVLVTFGGAVLVVLSLGVGTIFSNVGLYVKWVVLQLTLGQAYNPQEFRSVGVGVVNGSLWTITVEILFYLAVPVIVYVERLYKYALWVLCAFSLCIYLSIESLDVKPLAFGKTAADFLMITPIYWGWMFGVGMLFYKYYDTLIANRKALLFSSIVVIAVLLLLGRDGGIFGTTGNQLGLIYYLAYVAIIFYLAFSAPVVSVGFDISYGVYVWHMVFVNLVIMLGLVPWYGFFVSVMLTVVFAAISWFFVEKRFLKLKKYSMAKG